jgi:hypothetical protein
VGVVERDPKQAVLADLAASGTPFAADLSTVRFVKERRTPDRRLYWLAFEDHDGQPWQWLVAAVESEAGGWLAQDGAGGSGRGDLERADPWVNLAGWWGLDGFYAGGEIFAAGTEVAMVRLRFPNELILDDDAERGAALFLTDQRVEPPATVEICDRAGTTIASHEAF